MPPGRKPRRQPPPRRSTLHAAVDETQRSEERILAEGDLQGAPLQSESALPSEHLQPEDIAEEAAPNPLAAGTQPIATSPPRRMAPRLASLKQRKPPIPSLDPATSEPPKPLLKFQPKSALRRSKEERDAAEKAQAERAQSKLAADAKASAAAGGPDGLQGRGGRGGGRGIGRPDRDRFIGSQASGHLGGSTVGEDGGRKAKVIRAGFRGGTSEPSRFSARAKKDLVPKLERDAAANFVTSGSSHHRALVKEETLGPGYASSDDEPDIAEGPRVNIEHINLVSDHETDGNGVKKSNKLPGRIISGDTKFPGLSLKPIRIDRHEHIERTMVGNMEPSSLTSAELRRRAQERSAAEGGLFVSDDVQETGMGHIAKGKSKVKDVEFVRDERRWKGVYQEEEGETEPRIKEEPHDEDNQMMFDDVEPVTHLGDGRSPTAVEETIPHDVAAPAGHPPRPDRNHPGASKPEQSKRLKLKKPIFQTEEDRQEWNRYEEELEFLRTELGNKLPGSLRATATQPVDGEEVDQITDESTNLPDPKEGQVYLFQIPGIAPQLLTIAQNESRLKAQTEREKDASNPSAPDPEDVLSDQRTTNPSDIATAINPPRTPGKIGTLRVYDSGKVKIEWGNGGGASMELRRGFRSSMLQEVVMTNFERTAGKTEEGDEGGTKMKGEEPEKGKEKDQEKPEEKIDLGDTAWAVGELAGSFVMTPDWDKMLKR